MNKLFRPNINTLHIIIAVSVFIALLLPGCFDSNTEQAPASLQSGNGGGSNPPPSQNPDLAAGDDTLSVPVSTPGTVSVVNNDSSTIGEITIESYDQTSAHGGAIVYNGDGTFTYTPPAGFEGEDSFSYTIKDGSGKTATAKVVITVSNQVIPNGQAYYVANCQICHAASPDDTSTAFNASDLAHSSTLLITDLTSYGGEYQLMGAFYGVPQPKIDELKAYLTDLKSLN